MSTEERPEKVESQAAPAVQPPPTNQGSVPPAGRPPGPPPTSPGSGPQGGRPPGPPPRRPGGNYGNRPREPYRRGGEGGKGRPYFRRKVCRFCTQNLKTNYKVPDSMRRFVTDRGKILPKRITGTCAKHQRVLAREIGRARALALLPYAKK